MRTIHHDLHMDYSAVGQTTHLAARMEQLASPDAIVLTAATVRLVEGLMRVKAWGPVPIKGLAEPVEVWELLGVSGRSRRLQSARARGLTHFVGRQTEMTVLNTALAQAGAGHGQVVAVVGEAVESRGWWTSLSRPPTLRAGWCSTALPCPTARPRPISRSSTCCDAIATWRSMRTRALSRPR